MEDVKEMLHILKYCLKEMKSNPAKADNFQHLVHQKKLFSSDLIEAKELLKNYTLFT